MDQTLEFIPHVAASLWTDKCKTLTLLKITSQDFQYRLVILGAQHEMPYKRPDIQGVGAQPFSENQTPLRMS